MNIKQTALLRYLTDKFNDNSFGIPFRMGTYGLDEDSEGLVIYAPTRDNNGDFDRIDTFDETTYQTGKKAFVVMSGQMGSGEYVALPNIKMATYDVNLEFLVYMDNPISEIIRLAIEEVRDELIGNIETLAVKEIDFEDGNGDPTDVYLKLATTADGLDFGQPMVIKGRKYLNYSFTVSITVSKNVDFGNQVKWCAYKIIPEESAVEPETEATVEDVGVNTEAEDGTTWVGVEATPETYEWLSGDLVESPDYTVDSVEELPTPTSSGLTAKVNGPVVTKEWVYLGFQLGLTADYTLTGTSTSSNDFLTDAETQYPSASEDIGTIVKQLDGEGSPEFDEYYYAELQDTTVDDLYYISAIDELATYEWEYVGYSETCTEFIPLVASWGTNQDVEAFQTLRPYLTSTETLITRAKEVHNYVKSRGFGMTFTWLLDTTDALIRDFFIQTFKQQDLPPVYNIKMTMKEMDDDGDFVDSTDLTFERKFVYGEAQVSDVSYGEPIIFAIGFVPSAKDE
jgi:hypothetical protein